MFYKSKTDPQWRICLWNQVQNIDIEGYDVAKRKIAGALTFGLVGALTAKATKRRTYVLLKLKDGSEGIWQIDKKAPMEVRAALRPLLHEVGVAFGSEAPPAPQPPPADSGSHGALPLVADELAKLGELRDKGLLTNEEFAAQIRRRSS